MLAFVHNGESTTILRQSAVVPAEKHDVIVTDPPYYDAIPYSDLMDFFYVWLKRSLTGLSPEIDAVFSRSLGPKWDHESGDGELIDMTPAGSTATRLCPNKTMKTVCIERFRLAIARYNRRGG